MRYGITAIVAVLFLLWCYFCFLGMVFGMQEERRLFGGYVAVNRAPALSETQYEICRSKGLFFREKADWDSAFEIEYLERKYGQDFVEVPFDRETMYFYDDCEGGMPHGSTVTVNASHRNLPVHVVLAGGELDDNYIDLLTGWYLMKGCEEIEIDRLYRIEGDGTLRLYFAEGEDVGKIALDMRKLMRYALQDEIFKEYAGTIQLSPEGGEAYECIYISFGQVKNEAGMEYGYENNTDLLEMYIELCYENILNNRKERQRIEGGLEDREEETAEEEDIDEEEHVESVYEMQARLIYEEIRTQEDVGEFNVEYNAKGAEYYSLGEDGSYSYTLVYDRDSRNGACSLYVLYRSPYDGASGTYYPYTDTMTQIMDIYAVEKETLEIIPSGRKTWSDPGNSEYREAVGE